jgi:hypothetical protein
MKQVTRRVFNDPGEFNTEAPTTLQTGRTSLDSVQGPFELSEPHDRVSDDRPLFKPHDFLLLDLLAFQSEGDVHE